MTEWDQLQMDSSDELRLVANNQKRRLEQDRISQLHDSILHHIFSYLKTRNAVQSSVLSKRWRNLWASMQCLDFNCDEFEDPSDFLRFVNTVLVLRDQLDVHEFRLNWLCCDGDERDHVNMWIRYAVKHNVRVLHLKIDTSEVNHIRLPHCFFTCQSLEALHVSLSSYVDICNTWLPDFGRIKTLDLECVPLDDNLEELISGCPVIEDLRLRNCSFDSDFDSGVDIISQTMKSLWIENCCVNDKVIRISVPSLRALHYANSGIGKASLENMSSLVYAFISDNSFDGYGPDSSTIKIIKGLSNAKSLELYGLWTELVTEEELSEFPTLWNLRSLKMDKWRLSDNFQAVANFLRHSPNLEMLTLEQSSLQRFQSHYEETVNEESDKLSFDCPHLKTIEIQCDKYSKRSVPELVGILLENSRNSHSIMINPGKTLLRDGLENEQKEYGWKIGMMDWHRKFLGPSFL